MKQRYLGIGCTGGGLPECERDVKQLARAYTVCKADVTHVSNVVISPKDDVMPIQQWLTECDSAVVHVSSHGCMTPDGQYAFWWGEADVLYGDFIQQFIAPIATKAQVTLIIDSCFSGNGRTINAPLYGEGGNGKLSQLIKSYGHPYTGTYPKFEVTDHPDVVELDNIAVVCACGKKQYAYGQCVGYFEPRVPGKDVQSMSTLGASLWTYAWGTHIENCFRSTGLNPAQYNKLKRVFDSAKNCAACLNEGSGVAAWRNAPPPSRVPMPLIRIGKKHNGLAF